MNHRAGLIASLFVLHLSLAASAADRPPNIVLVLSDDHSHPYVGCYGMSELKTPNLDRFAGEGMKFTRMFTTAPQCVPSRASLMTGRSPVACRITRFTSPLPRDEITFPEILKQKAGYYTGVLGRSYHLDGSGNNPPASTRVLDQHNLRTFKERFDYVHSGGQQEVPARMREFFAARPAEKPFFLWVNFSDPHHPWSTGAAAAPKPDAIKVPGFLPDLPGVREELSRYMAEIQHADNDFQTVLDILKENQSLDNTLIFFIGDNGMAFPGGKGALHDPGLNVPLLVRWPGVLKPGGASDALISGEDLAPTCLQAAGLEVPQRISGVSFLPLLRGEKFDGRRHIFAERGPHGGATFTANTTANGIDYSRAVRSKTHKLIYNVTPSHRYAPVDSGGGPGWKQMTEAREAGTLPKEFVQRYFTTPRPVYELYDLEKDPYELTNLAGNEQTAPIEQELKEAMQEKMILDYDYLPLPIPTSRPRPAAARGRAQ